MSDQPGRHPSGSDGASARPWVAVGGEAVAQGRYYSRDNLVVHPAGRGASVWAVALNRTMLTCFSAEPGRVWATHAHESEQITLVLEGSLLFRVGDESVEVCAGEVFAVPSGVPHAVTAGATGAVAVDAWSPVMEAYRHSGHSSG